MQTKKKKEAKTWEPISLLRTAETKIVDQFSISSTPQSTHGSPIILFFLHCMLLSFHFNYGDFFALLFGSFKLIQWIWNASPYVLRKVLFFYFIVIVRV